MLIVFAMSTPPGPFRGIPAYQRATALVGIRFDAVCPDRGVHAGFQRQRHYASAPAGEPADEFSFQKRSDKYFSPPSGKIATTTASVVVRATCSAPARAAP